MTITVTALWRHPIKSHGREELDRVTLTKGQTMPFDRRWAIAHEMAKSDGTAWASCANYSRGSKAPSLMAINARCDEASGLVTLSHPQQDDLTFNPDQDADIFLNWVKPIMPSERSQSAAIHRVEGRGMTDTDYPSISLLNVASGESVAQDLSTNIDACRWRCNIHFSGLPAWEELTWQSHRLKVGESELLVREPITRCMATTVNPETGERDADTLGALKRIGNHQYFGIYAEVTKTGDIHLGDEIKVL